MSDPPSAHARLAGLTREQRALLFEQLRRRQERFATPPERIPRRPPDLDPVPASFAQERLWFMDRLAPGNPAYNIPAALRILGEIAPAALEAALGEVVRRHEALRTSFGERDGQPVQVIAPPGRRSLPVVDLSALPAGERERAARGLAQEAAVRPFDLARGPLLRALLLRLTGREHVLLLALHHIVADGWSTGVLVGEVAALYGAAAAGASSPLPPLPIQYADFALWQRGRLAGGELERQVAFWRGELAGAPATLDLPADRPRPAVQTYRGARLPVVLGPGFADELARLARRCEASPFMALLAGFQALLGRLTGQQDLTVGSLIANRTHREIEGLIGFFVNMLALRGDLAGDPPFGELLARVRRTALAAYAHQDLPFERLVLALQPERHLAVTPLFQVVCGMQNAPAGRVELPGLALAPLELEATTAQFDLELNFWEEDGALAAALTFSGERFDAATARRLAGHLAALLGAALADPGRRLSELPLLSAPERHQLVAEWNDTVEAAAPRGVLARFAARAAGAPDAVALEQLEQAEGRVLTFGELDRRSTLLAARLRRAGVGPGAAVGLLAERSLETAAGILGIWKAGGAYLPLDPALPAARLAYLLEDSAAPVVATTRRLAGLLASLSPTARRALLDDCGEGEEREDPAPAAEAPAGAGGPARPGDPAYLLYTSGTTGRPKAVLVEHAQLASTLGALDRAFPFLPGDRLPAIASSSFDIFLFELLGPLLGGGTCALLPLDPALDLEALAGALADATVLHAVPAVMRRLVELARRRPALAPALRALFTGGDAVPADLLADLRALFPQAAVRVLYGPTETAIVCTSWTVPAAGPARSLLGRPLAGVEIRVCDGAGRPVPIGVPGEVWIGGAGVARGYWRRPELTAEKFVERDGRRWFRSGDLARHLPDGALEFLGRADQQVKVRGFRIELGEVESHLLGHPAVREAVAAVRKEPGGDRRLVAYVVLRGSRHPAGKPAGEPAGKPTGEPDEEPVGELRRHLAVALPDYMVPTAFVVLDRLPVTAHGKVDRAALPAPGPPRGRWGAATPPGTPAERQMAALWREVLGVGEVALEDNFFALGGHSLLAAQLVSRVRAACGVDLPLRRVFEQPTLGEMSAAISDIAGIAGDVPGAVPAARPPLARPPRREAPLSFAQEYFWAVSRGNTAYNMPSPLRLRGPVDPRLVERCLREVLGRHGALRTRFEQREDAPVQVIDPPGSETPRWSLPWIDLEALPPERREEEVPRLIDEESVRPFDLARGPLLRAALARLAAGEHVLLLSCHHLVADGWSMGVLIDELIALYGALAAGLPPPLPVLPVQYADLAAEQRERLAGPALEARLERWRERLAGAPRLLALPLDRPRPAQPSLCGDRIDVLVPADLARRLGALAVEEKASLYMVLLAALARVLGRWSGQDDVVVGSPAAGRDRRETEGMIGVFLNVLPIRVDLSGGPGFRELLARVRRACLDAYTDQEYPFERLVERLGLAREPSHMPVFQVVLNVLNLPAARGELPGGIHVEQLPGERVQPRYDFSLYGVETAEGLLLRLSYAVELFDRARMEELLRELEATLARAAEETGFTR